MATRNEQILNALFQRWDQQSAAMAHFFGGFTSQFSKAASVARGRRALPASALIETMEAAVKFGERQA